MKTIWKYHPTIEDTVTFIVPPETKFLSAGVDPSGELCVWMEVRHPEKEKTSRIKCGVYGTGQEVPEGMTFLGTVLMTPFVWHVYHKEIAP